MFETFFEMKATPFVRDVPIDQLFESHETAEILARLKYAADHEQFAVITSAPGLGKSTLIRKFVGLLPQDRYLVLYLSDSKLTPKWFYKGLLDQMGIDNAYYRGDAKRQLQREIEIIHGVENKKVVCILDEAHLLEKETLEEFRFMLNYRFDSVSPMALVLVGQTELWDEKLCRQKYNAIRQRIDVYSVLHPLDRAETERYIKAHLDYSGCEKEIFTAAAIDEIFGMSGGIPRNINRLCTNALRYAFMQERRLIDDHMIQYMCEHEVILQPCKPDITAGRPRRNEPE